jgi:hypothetical protein
VKEHEPRILPITQAYADAVLDVSKEPSVESLDLWTAFMTRAGQTSGHPLVGSKEGDQNIESGRPLLLWDGLHITLYGNRLVFDTLINVTEKE